MTIEQDSDGNITITGEGIDNYRFLVHLSGLRLWIKTGIQPTRGVTILKACKQHYGLTGNKYAILAQMEAIWESKIAGA